MKRKGTIAPELPIDAVLRCLRAVADGSADAFETASVEERLGALPPVMAVRLEPRIAAALQPVPRYMWRYDAGDRNNVLDRLSAAPRLSSIFLFHPDGYVREAALHTISGPIQSPFYFAAICWRLNDWALSVRSAALACAGRTFSETPALVVAEAKIALQVRMGGWGRWRHEKLAVDRVFSRADVEAIFLNTLLGSGDGGTIRLVREALRSPDFDHNLAKLAMSAKLPHLRAVALKVLLSGFVSWRTGYDWTWENKIYGRKRRIAVIQKRPVSSTVSIMALIEHAAGDRSSLVRKIAADGLIDHWQSLANRDVILERLSGDPSPAVRERVDYISRKLINPESRSHADPT
jgi:hypothetical protein